MEFLLFQCLKKAVLFWVINIFLINSCFLLVYSSRKASIGLTLVALNAGINPIKVPKTTKIIKAINTTAMDTDAFTMVASETLTKGGI